MSSGACRPLWQEAFPEDSREFADYYFDKKILQSSVLVKEDGTGRIVTMAHMNPYRINVGKKMWKLDYIVGVATAADSRHRGHMRDVLMKMLGTCIRTGSPSATSCLLRRISTGPLGSGIYLTSLSTDWDLRQRNVFRGGNFGWTEISVPRWPDG